MSDTSTNVSPDELAKFDAAASRWWDPEGEFKPLHRLNPLRLDYIGERVAGVDGKRILDVGCGGGLLAEGLARRGARVTGIDLASGSLEVARLHALDSGEDIRYRLMSAEALAGEEPGIFDVVACLEMLEHVPDPGSVIDACARLVRPGGHVIFSTLSRTPRAWAFAVVGAEYVLGLLPKGTHDYSHFIRPSELDLWCRQSRLTLLDLKGIRYNPLTSTFRLGRDVRVNYLAHFRAPDPNGDQ